MQWPVNPLGQKLRLHDPNPLHSPKISIFIFFWAFRFNEEVFLRYTDLWTYPIKGHGGWPVSKPTSPIREIKHTHALYLPKITIFVFYWTFRINEKVFLRYIDLWTHSVKGHDRITHLQCPRVHDLLHVTLTIILVSLLLKTLKSIMLPFIIIRLHD